MRRQFRLLQLAVLSGISTPICYHTTLADDLGIFVKIAPDPPYLPLYADAQERDAIS